MREIYESYEHLQLYINLTFLPKMTTAPLRSSSNHILDSSGAPIGTRLSKLMRLHLHTRTNKLKPNVPVRVCTLLSVSETLCIGVEQYHFLPVNHHIFSVFYHTAGYLSIPPTSACSPYTIGIWSTESEN